MSEKVEFKKQRAFGEVVNDTFLFIRENFKPLLKVFLYLCGFFILAGIITGVMQQIAVLGMAKSPDNPFALRSFIDVFTWNYFLVMLVSIATYTAISVSTLSYIAVYIQKGNVAPSPEEVWAYFKYYYSRTFFSGIVLSLLFVIALVCCIVPAVYIFPAMSLFYPVMILENAKFDYSFSRSFKLLKDQWWVTAAVILIIWVITYACMMFASVPGAILTMIGTFVPGLEEWNKAMIVIGTVLQHISYVFLIIPGIGAAFCYFNLVEVQESTGLMDRIHQFGEDKNDNSGLEEY